MREVRRQGDYCFPKPQAGDDRAEAVFTRIGHNFTRILPQRGTISKAGKKLAFFCAIILRVMTDKTIRNLVANKLRLLKQIQEIDKVIHEIAVKGVSSAAISAGGGSKSYTRLDIAELKELRAGYADEVSQINRRLAGGTPGGIRHIMTVRI